MRREDREVTDINQIDKILSGCRICHLAMMDDDQPYVIPLSYAHQLDNGVLTLFFHSAREGRKIRILQKNNSVCFVMSNEGELSFSEETPCKSGYFFSSVHGFGIAKFVDDVDEKCLALKLLMKHQAKIDVDFVPSQADGVCVFKVVSTDFIGKMKKRPSIEEGR